MSSITKDRILSNGMIIFQCLSPQKPSHAESIPMSYPPIVLYIRQLSIVMNMKATSHTCPLLIADVPNIMKMTVSVILLNILRKYLMVVCDLSEMLNITYCFMTIPQNVKLKKEPQTL